MRKYSKRTKSTRSKTHEEFKAYIDSLKAQGYEISASAKKMYEDERRLITQELLVQSGVHIIEDDNEVGGYRVYQDTNKGTSRRPIYVNIARHPYGRDKVYLLVNVGLKLEDKYVNATMPLHRLVYVYFKGNFPEDYDIAHIDDDPINCRLDNLIAISHKDNIRMRKHNGANQYK